MMMKFLLLLSLLAISIQAFADKQIILPPEPSEFENSRTLLGVDSNNNDVRDDVEIYIYNKITTKPDEYFAFLQFARGHQRYLKLYPDIQKLKANESYKNQTIDCFNVLGKDRFQTSELNTISSLTFNTNIRREIRKAYGPLSYKIAASFVLKDKKSINKEEVCK